MLLDQSDAPVRYEPVSTPPGPSVYLQPSTVNIVRSARQHIRMWNSTAQLAVFAQAAAIFICEVFIPSRTAGAEKLVLGEFVTATSHGQMQQAEPTNSVIEMRTAHKSLRDVASATTPGEAPPDDFYDATPLEPQLLYQGEILVDVPFLNIPKSSRWLLLRTASGRRVHEALEHGAKPGTVRVLDSNMSNEQWYADGLGDYAMALLDKRPVLVLSQTCDIQSKDFIQVAPIFPASAEGVEAEAGDLDNLKSGAIINAFWLKPHLPEIQADSFSDLTLIQAVHKSYVKRIRPNQHFRLKPDLTRLLQKFITRYFGRPNSFDSRSDKAPRAGTYLCASCFYMHGRITGVAMEEASAFPDCPTCGPAHWVLQGS